MGFYYHGVPDYLISWGQANLGDALAIETGTYRGDSALLLADAFGACVTIEKDPQLATDARHRFADDPRITVLEGSSREILHSVLAPVNTPPFVWLDAHWSGGSTAGSDDPCPVLAEIALIAEAFGDESFIAIDDARIFAAADPSDEINNTWPSLFEVLASLEGQGLATYIIDDVVIGVSPRLSDSVGQLVPVSWMGRHKTLQIYEAQRTADHAAPRRDLSTLRTKVTTTLAKTKQRVMPGR